ncbi:MAG TPA: hypothetical protein VJY35_04200 [Candidatus Eisenbacteria bacterium]|nr:hypothetical protein [Candidatus Eisenbacteria bacterium]
MATKRAAGKNAAQAWIELRTTDPEAESALGVIRAHTGAGRQVRALRRLRLLELAGPLPARAALEALLHRSIQFYNPHKERCSVRTAASDAAPIDADEQVVLVWERNGERREAAERWWRHETGQEIVVREGVAWVLGLEPGTGNPAQAVEDLAVVRDRRHGLFCNPHAQECRIAAGSPPIPWMGATEKPREARG